MKFGRQEVRTPAVCGAVIGNSVEEMKKVAGWAVRDGAGLIELRIDGLRGRTGWERLLKGKLPVIVTNMSKREGGFFQGSDKERTEELMRGVELGASCIDLELSTPPGLRSQVIKNAKRKGVSTIVSHHNFSGTPEPAQLLKIADKIAATGCDIVKIVAAAKDRKDALRMMDFIVQTQGRLEIPVIAFSMGDTGIITRFIGPIFGSPLVYAAAGKRTAPGQLDVSATKALLRELMPEEVSD
ncbi:MAG: type I 3-dehydroquinate dehydratase [Candidatus Hadarchaeota archaeon]